MFEIIFLVVLAAFAIGGIWAYVVSKKVKEEGIETDAVVSRIELHEYTNQEGKTVEAMLSNPGDHKFEEGDRLRIKYLPDKQEYPVMVENC